MTSSISSAGSTGTQANQTPDATCKQSSYFAILSVTIAILENIAATYLTPVYETLPWLVIVSLGLAICLYITWAILGDKLHPIVAIGSIMLLVILILTPTVSIWPLLI